MESLYSEIFKRHHVTHDIEYEETKGAITIRTKEDYLCFRIYKNLASPFSFFLLEAGAKPLNEYQILSFLEKAL